MLRMCMCIFVVVEYMYQAVDSSADLTPNDLPQGSPSLVGHPPDGPVKVILNSTSSSTAPPTNTLSTKLSLPAITYQGQTFRETKTSRKEYIVVDKTSFLKELLDNSDINSVEKIYFLARPRTFGKAFFLSMVHEFLNGTKEFFENTAISRRGNTIEADGKWKMNITFEEKFSSIMGFTVDETRENFKAHLQILAKEHDTDVDTMLQKIINQYGGYRFSTETSDTLLDPGSVCSCMRELGLYDFRTDIVGITGIIARMTKEQKGISYFKYYCICVQELYDPMYYAIEKWQPPLHKQMLSDGYLTIKTYCQKSQMVYLHYPNKGVEECIESDLPANLKSKPHDELHYEPLTKLLQDSLDKRDIDHFVELFNDESFPMMSSSLESCAQNSEEEFVAAAKITQTLKTLKFDCAKGIALKTEGSDGGNLDMVIFAQEDGKPHFVFEFKFSWRQPLEQILQLFKYVVTLNTDFESVFDNKPKCNVIYLLGMVVEPYEGRETITDWILVPYEYTKIRIDKASSSGRGKWLLDLYIVVTNSEYFKQHEKYFILPRDW